MLINAARYKNVIYGSFVYIFTLVCNCLERNKREHSKEKGLLKLKNVLPRIHRKRWKRTLMNRLICKPRTFASRATLGLTFRPSFHFFHEFQYVADAALFISSEFLLKLHQAISYFQGAAPFFRDPIENYGTCPISIVASE